MSVLFNNNKLKYGILNVSYEKIKINNLFVNSKYILYIYLDKVYEFKDFFLNYNVTSFILKDKYMKSLFSFPNFSFLRGGLLCLFINDIKTFINITKILEKKQFFYSYNKHLSHMVVGADIFEQYSKYNTNYVYIQFILKKIKVKIIIIFIFFLIYLIKYIK